MFVSPKSKHTLPPKSKLKSLLSNTLTQNEGNYLQLQVQPSPAALLQLVLSFTHLPPTRLPLKSTAATSVFH